MRGVIGRSLSAAVGGVVLATSGCGWIGTRSDFNRDPFVMSHLTHSKEDPLFASSENEPTFDEAEAPVKSASVSRKTDYPGAGVEGSASTDGARLGRGADYRWLKGRLGFKRGKRSGWYIRYARLANDDRYGGELLISEAPQLGFLREGDRVYVEGALVSSDPADARYRVESIALLD